MPRLFSLSKGIPRVINVICDRALLGVFAQGKRVVDSRTLSTAAEEVFGKPRRVLYPRSFGRVLAALFLICFGLLISLGYQHVRSGAVTEEQTGAASLEKRGYSYTQWQPLEFFPLLPMQPFHSNHAPANNLDYERFLPEASLRRGGVSAAEKRVLLIEAVSNEISHATETEDASSSEKETR
jgi:hypothetical protein